MVTSGVLNLRIYGVLSNVRTSNVFLADSPPPGTAYCCRSVLLMCKGRSAAVIHFQVQTAAVQSHFNTNCLRSHKGACAPQLTPPVPALQCHVSSGTHKIAATLPASDQQNTPPRTERCFSGQLVAIAFLTSLKKKGT